VPNESPYVTLVDWKALAPAPELVICDELVLEKFADGGWLMVVPT